MPRINIIWKQICMLHGVCIYMYRYVLGPLPSGIPELQVGTSRHPDPLIPSRHPAPTPLCGGQIEFQHLSGCGGSWVWCQQQGMSGKPGKVYIWFASSGILTWPGKDFKRHHFILIIMYSDVHSADRSFWLYTQNIYIYIGMIDKKIYSHKYLFIYIYIQIQHINLDLYN